MPRTDYMILRRTPYMESSLIVSGISPDFGRLDFLLRGARKTGRKNFPFACLFRELSIEFRLPRGESTLSSLQSHEPLRSHDDLALAPETYLAACDIASFLLRNTRFQLPVPRTFRALSNMFARAGTERNAFPWLPYAQLVFLHENGFVSAPPEKEKILCAVFDFAEGRTDAPPPFSDRYLTLFTAWIRALSENRTGSF